MGELALHKTAGQAKPTLAKPLGNAGLWWNKFCNAWRPGFAGIEEPQREGEGGKLEWIKTLAGSRLGDEALLREHADRRKQLVAAAGGRTETLELQARFVSGTGIEHPVEVGMLFHHTLGIPYLAAASVKGLARAWASQWKSAPKEETDRVFGPGGQRGHVVGSVIFLDALPVAPVRLVAEVMTPHYGPWYQAGENEITEFPPADWYDPIPIPFLAVAENQLFTFALLPNPHGKATAKPEKTVTAEQARRDVGTAGDWLVDALQWLGAGAKTAVGFGRFGTGPLPRPEPSASGRGRSAAPRQNGGAGGRLAVGSRVAHDITGSEGTLLGYERGMALVDFGDGPEAVRPGELRPLA